MGFFLYHLDENRIWVVLERTAFSKLIRFVYFYDILASQIFHKKFILLLWRMLLVWSKLCEVELLLITWWINISVIEYLFKVEVTSLLHLVHLSFKLLEVHMKSLWIINKYFLKTCSKSLFKNRYIASYYCINSSLNYLYIMTLSKR